MTVQNRCIEEFYRYIYVKGMKYLENKSKGLTSNRAEVAGASKHVALGWGGWRKDRKLRRCSNQGILTTLYAITYAICKAKPIWEENGKTGKTWRWGWLKDTPSPEK